MKKVIFFLVFAQNIDCGYIEAVLKSTHNLCFKAKIKNMYIPVNPSFTIKKWGVRGSSLHGHGCMMSCGMRKISFRICKQGAAAS